MTTVKPETKASTTAGKEEATKQEDLQTACEIHTISQLVYGQIAASHPWIAPVSPLASFQPPTAWMPPIAPGASSTWFSPTPWTW